MYYLGGAYYYGGFGLVKSIKKAAKIWKRAVELGSLPAMVQLALIYLKGEGVKPDKKKAMQLLRRASEKNYAHGQYLLSRELDAEFVAYADAEITKLHAKPASERQAGDEDALVKRLEANQESLSKEVYRYGRLSAEQGFIPAMRSLGICYIQGHGVERDVDEARRWLERAAAAGDARSIEELEKLNA